MSDINSSVRELAGVIKRRVLEVIDHELEGEYRLNGGVRTGKNLVVHIIQGPYFTAVHVSTNIESKVFFATGLSKTHWRDKPTHSHKLGREIAVGRAAFHLARKLVSHYVRQGGEKFVSEVDEAFSSYEKSGIATVSVSGIAPSNETVPLEKIKTASTH